MGALLQPGQLVAERYRVEAFLAAGGMGEVFVARHVQTELRIALKVLCLSAAGAAEREALFVREAAIAAKIGGDHVVTVFDAGRDTATGLWFIAMELLEGQSFEALVTPDAGLPPERCARYMAQVASALARAHAHRVGGQSVPIVHRDLKPSNVFLTRREQGERLVKVLDFGLAKLAGDGASISREIKGTPFYMAYEQLTGERISPQTDVWAFGLIAFYLLTGRVYWRSARAGAQLPAVIAEVMTLPLDPPSQRLRALGSHATLPPAFDAWFARCVDRDSERRFARIEQAAAALEVALLSGPVAAQGAEPSAAPAYTAAPALMGTVRLAQPVPSASAEVERSTGAGAAARSRPVRAWLAVGLLLLAGLAVWWALAARPQLLPAGPARALVVDEVAPAADGREPPRAQPPAPAQPPAAALVAPSSATPSTAQRDRAATASQRARGTRSGTAEGRAVRWVEHGSSPLRGGRPVIAAPTPAAGEAATVLSDVVANPVTPAGASVPQLAPPSPIAQPARAAPAEPHAPKDRDDVYDER